MTKKIWDLPDNCSANNALPIPCVNACVQIGVHHSLPYCLRKSLSWSPEITDVAGLASQRAPGILLSVSNPSVGITDVYHCSQLFVWVLGSVLWSSCLRIKNLTH